MKHDAVLFRNDIQGIRALAVLSVIAYHLPLSSVSGGFIGVDLVSGGFIGVDIFFVLSGYVITASSLKLLSRGEWRSVAAFYGKRARRLFPALLFTVVLGLAAMAYLVPPDNSKLEGFRTGLFSVSGLANNYLLEAANDYWKEDGLLNPFLHMWSLGVEFQYYAAYPIVGFLYFRFLASSPPARSLSQAAFALIVIASLAAYLSGESYELKQFYLVHYRLWQFGIGMAAYLIVSQYQDGFLATGKIVKYSRLLLNEITYTALIIAMILVGIDYLGKQLMTVYSCLLTGLYLVLNAKPSYSPWSLLGYRLALCFVDISYSLYLIHWPVIFVFNYIVFFDSRWVYMYCLLVIFALSYFSWFFIEHFFRKRGSQGQILGATFVTMVVVFMVADNSNLVRRLPFYSTIGLSLKLDGFHNFWWTGLDDAKHLYKHTATFNTARGYREYDARTSSYFAHIRSTNQPSSGTLIAFGNSYIQSSGAMLLAYAEANNLDLKLRHIMNCNGETPQCGQAFDEVIELIRTEAKPVFIFSAFNLPSKGHFIFQKFPEVLRAAAEMNVPLIIQGASPSFPAYNPKQCISPFKKKSEGCTSTAPLEPMLKRLASTRASLAVLAGDKNEALFWKPWSIFCTPTACRNSMNGVSLLRDQSHFSVYGSLQMYDDFAAFVGEKIGTQ